MMEVDGQAETEGRRLLLAAFDAAGAGDADGGDALADGLAGAELLREVRRRTARRRRTRRALVPAGAVTALAGAAAAAVTLTATVASAPSAAAAVTAAAGKTSADSFRVTMNIAFDPPPGPRNGHVQAARVSGEYDPVRGVGEETVSGQWKFQVRYIGQRTYLDTYPGSKPVIIPDRQGPKPWGELPPQPAGGGTALEDSGDDPAGTPANPITLLGLFKSAGKVIDQGPASGPGWNGTKYGFTLNQGKEVMAGYVDVDGQGRVRRLVADLTDRTGPSPWVAGSEDVTFSDFGAPVSVSPPPASQVYRLGFVAVVSLGW